MAKTFDLAKLSRNMTLSAVGEITIGTEDSVAGALQVAGPGSGGNEGGEIRLFTAADHDTTYNFYRIDVFQDDLRFGRQGQTDMTIDSSGNTTFSGTVTGPTTDTLLIKNSAGSTLKTIRGV